MSRTTEGIGQRIRSLLKRWHSRLVATGASQPTRGVSAAAPPRAPTTSATVADPSGDHTATGTQRPLHSAAIMDVIIGLDFGSSMTKVAVRTPYLHGGRALLVPLSSTPKSSSDFLFPSALWRDSSGACSLQKLAESRCFSDLKVKLLDNPQSVEAQALSTTYLALVLRRAQTWFRSDQRALSNRASLRWVFNLGIPSSGYDDAPNREGFRKVFAAACVLSGTQYPLTLGASRAALSERREQPDNIEVVPEVAAEVAGYARSPRRGLGLHMIVDVGATTLDICGFILRESDGEDCYSLLATSVKRLGAYQLHIHRLSELRTRGAPEVHFPSISIADPHSRIPQFVREYVDGQSFPRNDLEAIDDNWRTLCAESVHRILVALKSARDPNSPRWKDGLPVFLCGGGGHLRPYTGANNQAWSRFERNYSAAGFRLMTLSRPEALATSEVAAVDYHRFAVAYGLSFDALDIGKIDPPHQIGDVELNRRSRQWQSAYVSKDQV